MSWLKTIKQWWGARRDVQVLDVLARLRRIAAVLRDKRSLENEYRVLERRYLDALQQRELRAIEAELTALLPQLEEAASRGDPRMITLYQRAASFYGAVLGEDLTAPVTLEEEDRLPYS